MSHRFISFVVLVLLTTALILISWSAFPHVLLWIADRDLQDLYRAYRPFPYRWWGAAHGDIQATVREVPKHLLAKELNRIQRAEASLGSTIKSRSLFRKAELLAGEYQQAATDCHRELFVEPDNARLKLEYGIALALLAKKEARPLDYESAMEQMLESEHAEPTPESAFDLAVIFSDVPLPRVAVEQWRLAISREASSPWRLEAEGRLKTIEGFLDTRDRQIDELTKSPASYLSHIDELGQSVEVVASAALEHWLSNYYTDKTTRNAIRRLASILKDEYADFWFSDLLRTPASTHNQQAFASLSQAAEANSRGEYSRAERLALTAEESFQRGANFAGVLRSRLERVYSLDRQSHTATCLQALVGILKTADKHKYLWIEGQARLEKTACQTQTQTVDVIDAREKAFEWIEKTKYEGLRLRALSFLTEDVVCFGSRLTQWMRGYQGISGFWKSLLPPLRVESFYFSLASSARRQGDFYAAIALLEESLRAAKISGNRSVVLLLMADLGAWTAEASLYTAANEAFEQMREEISQANKDDATRFLREAEITHAMAEITSGHPDRALIRLQQLLDSSRSPNSNFPPFVLQRLLRGLGDCYLALGDIDKASKFYMGAVQSSKENLKTIQDYVQRQNVEREIESAWRGLAQIQLERGNAAEALYVWEDFRGGGRPDISNSKIPPGTSLLVFAFLPKGLSAWIMDGQGVVEQHWIQQLTLRKVEHFSELVSDPDSPLPMVSAAALELYNTLLQPFEGRLPRHGTLVIDADGPLAGIPWSALENAPGHPLLERLAIAQITGMRELLSHVADRSPDLSKALILGEPLLGVKLAAQFPPLLEVKLQAEWLHKELPSATFFEGPGSTFDAFVRHIPFATALHFGGHGISNGGFGALLLSPSTSDSRQARILMASDISRLPLKELQLVVLAACSSGAGETSGTVNLDSLVRAFLEAGALRVVAARWNVDYRETGHLISGFYREIFQGRLPAEALRNAAIIVRRNPSSSHPYYWASFQVFGAP